MNQFYELIRRSSALIVALSDNAAFAALIMSYPNIKPQHLVILHLIAMVAKSIYYKGNKVVKEEEKSVDIIGLPEPRTDKKTVFELGVGRNFIYNGGLYIKTNQQNDKGVYVVELSMGTMALLPKNTEVEPKLVTCTINKPTGYGSRG